MAFFLDCFAWTATPPPPTSSNFDPQTLNVGELVLVRDEVDEEWSRGVVRSVDEDMGVKVQLVGWGNPYYYDWICSRGLVKKSSRNDGEKDDVIDLSEKVPGYWGPVVGQLAARGEDSVVKDFSGDGRGAVQAAYDSDEGRLFRELFGRWSDDAGRQASERDKEKMRQSHTFKTSGKSSNKRGSIQRGKTANEEEEEEEDEEREKEELSEHTLTYGEILYSTFVACVLDRVRAHGGLGPGSCNGVFTDIGCGTAKPVFASALTHSFAKCRGVEVLPDLSRFANEIADVYRREIQPRVGSSEDDPRRRCEIEILHADAFADSCDWSDSDVVFANSTCFTEALFKAFAAKIKHLKPGSFVVTTTTRLWKAPWIECLEMGTLKEDWGKTSVYVHRRVPLGTSDTRRGMTPEEYEADRKAYPSLYTPEYLKQQQQQQQEEEGATEGGGGGGGGEEE